ncbi:MAG: hypothetical protein DRI44_07550 [Chlamydiae bacterium]|nr:MAG: hypothetical protein DRI44_07550 [Chlamydiota bacterium]
MKYISLNKIFPAITLCLFVSFIAVAYSACSPKVTVVGDKDHPVAINAEIKIHIYQHAAQDVDEIMEGINDEEMEEEQPTSMLAKTVLIVQNLGVSTAYAAKPKPADKKAVIQKIKPLYRAAYPYLKKGVLGENKDGYVELINKNSSAKSEEITKAAKIADKLNAARKELYQISATLSGTDIRIQQEAYSTAFRQKAKKGTWIQRKKGKEWIWMKK